MESKTFRSRCQSSKKNSSEGSRTIGRVSLPKLHQVQSKILMYSVDSNFRLYLAMICRCVKLQRVPRRVVQAELSVMPTTGFNSLCERFKDRTRRTLSARELCSVFAKTITRNSKIVCHRERNVKMHHNLGGFLAEQRLRRGGSKRRGTQRKKS